MEVKTGYKQTEVGVIPEDWGVKVLANLITSLEAGVSVNSVDKEESTFAHECSILKTSCVIGGKFIPEERKTIVPQEVHRARLSPRKDSIVISRMNTPALVGECGYIARDYPNLFLPDRLWMTRHDARLPHSVRWLAYLLSSTTFSRAIKETATGTSGSMKNISKGSLLAVQIPFPATQAEQEAIAGALSDADALIESLEQLLGKKRQFKQGATQELLTGKKRLPGFVTTCGYKQTEFGVIPEDWIQTDLQGIAIKIGSGITPTGGSIRYKTVGRPFVRSQNVGWGQLLLDDLAFIDDDTHSTFPATELKSEDVLLNITGASIGRSALADCQLSGGNVNQHVCIVRLNPDKAAPKLINMLLLSDLGQRQIASFQAGGNRQGLNFTQIASIKIPLPAAKTEQTAIATTLSDMDAEIAALEAGLGKVRQIKQGMMQELLTGRIRLV